MATCLSRRVSAAVSRQEWARTHQTHLATDHIHQLRQFVQAGCAQPGSELGQAALVGLKLTGRIAIARHRSEFQDLERLPAKPETLLAEQSRRPEILAYAPRYPREQWRQQCKRGHADDEIHRPFGEARLLGWHLRHSDMCARGSAVS